MKYEIKALEYFKKQVEKLDKKSRERILKKILLIKQNPYRYKAIHSKLFKRVFCVRLKIQNKETRLIYLIVRPDIILVCLLDRAKNYKDLEKYLKKAKQLSKK